MDVGEESGNLPLGDNRVTPKTEGTLIVDGLLEGKLPPSPEAAERLRQWVCSAAEVGLVFSVEIDGGSFSLLADTKPIAADPLGTDPAAKIADLLDGLLEVFPLPQRQHVNSTLRTKEYRRGQEVQTLFAVGSDGAVEMQERVVEAQTIAPPRPRTRKEIVRLVLLGVAVVLLVLLVSSIFVDYPALLDRVIEGVTPFDADSLQVDTGSFGDYLTVEAKERADGGKGVVITLKRAEAFPVTEADLKRLLAEAGDSPSAHLAVEALARGYIRCELFNKDGGFLGSSMQRIAGLREQETVKIAVPLPRKERLARVVFTY